MELCPRSITSSEQVIIMLSNQTGIVYRYCVVMISQVIILSKVIKCKALIVEPLDNLFRGRIILDMSLV